MSGRCVRVLSVRTTRRKGVLGLKVNKEEFYGVDGAPVSCHVLGSNEKVRVMVSKI